MACQLYCNRTDAPSAPDDHDRACGTRHRTSNVEAIKQRLPGSDRRQRSAPASANPNVPGLDPTMRSSDQVELRIGSRAIYRARIEHFVAWLEQLRLRADFRNDTGRVVAHDFPLLVQRCSALAYLVVDRG